MGLLLLGGLGGLAGCNTITGANDLQIAGGEGGADPGTNPLTQAGATIAKISLSQGVERVLAEAGVAASSDVPVVAGREGLLRVFVGADRSALGTTVDAKLWLDGRLLDEQALVVDAPSREASLGSTLDFPIAGAELQPGTSFRVELSGEAVHGPLARYPLKGDEVLAIATAAPTLNLVIVPIAYEADGSGRTPKITPAVIAKYQRSFEAVYPVAHVAVTVRAPWSWNHVVNAGAPNDTSWQDMLDAFDLVRANDDAPFDAYYFGAFEPTEHYDHFCPPCIRGLGFVVDDASDAIHRAAIGLGYEEHIGEIAPHEVGHEHGRRHAPSGVTDDVDPDYPYEGGGIGVWGYDVRRGKLKSPKQFTDMMGYGDETWISDYTYAGIFSRMLAVGFHAPTKQRQTAALRTFSRARVNADGSLTRLEPITARHVGAGRHRVELETARGSETTMAEFTAYDHAPGGVLTWPAPKMAATHVRVTVGEHVLDLAP